MSDRESLTVKIAQEIAPYEGVSPDELDPPLYDVINTDALDTLFKSSHTGFDSVATLEFPYNGYIVRVEGSGEIEVHPRKPAEIE